MATIKKLPVHNGFATGIKHWHVAHIENTLFSIRERSFHLIECNAGAAFTLGRKSTFIKAIDMMCLYPNLFFHLTLNEMLDRGQLEHDVHKYLYPKLNGTLRISVKVYQEMWNNINPNYLIGDLLLKNGLFYIDTPGTIPPFHKYNLIGCNSRFDNYDFLINTFPRSWKRHLGKKHPPEMIKSSGVPLKSLPEYISMLNRKHWFIRDSCGLSGAILLFGTNNHDPQMTRWSSEIDMFDISTPRGKEIFERHSILQTKLKAKK